MDKRLQETTASLTRRITGIAKTKLMYVLFCVGVIAFGVAVDTFDPVEQRPKTFEMVQAEQAEVSRALQEGRQPDLTQFRPYDNFYVTGYLIPLFGIWMLCKFARRRDRLPVSVFALVAGLWFASSLVWSAGPELLAIPFVLFAPLHWFDPADPGTFVYLVVPALVLALAGVGLWLFLRLLAWTAGWLDPLLRGRRGYPTEGPRPPAAPVSTTRLRVGLAASILALSPLLWWLYDWFDTSAIPGPFALGARGIFVAYALWLMTRVQIDLAWPNPGLQHGELTPEYDPEYEGFNLDT